MGSSLGLAHWLLFHRWIAFCFIPELYFCVQFWLNRSMMLRIHYCPFNLLSITLLLNWFGVRHHQSDVLLIFSVLGALPTIWLLTSLCLTATTMWRWYCFNIIYSILSDVYSHTRIFIISISFFWQDQRVAYCLMLVVLVRKTIFTFFCPSYFIFIGLELHYAPSIFVVFSCNFQPFSAGFWD